MGLSTRQHLTVAFVRSEIAAGRPFPTTRQIADHMGWSETSRALDMLQSLLGKGLVRTAGNKVLIKGSKRHVWELVEDEMTP